jgi:ATP adenylyltransferase
LSARRDRPAPRRKTSRPGGKDLLWAPWRMELFSAPKLAGCIFCDLPRRKNPRENLVLATTRSSVVMLNRYPYASGHVMVAPRRHVGWPSRLRPMERAELAETLYLAGRIVERDLGAQGLNLGMNLGSVAGAGIADHIHWHVVPRWAGDTNFMPAIASVRVMPQHLLDTWDRLHGSFAKLSLARGGKRPPR